MTKYLFALALLLSTLCSATVITSTTVIQGADGQPFNGTITFTLNAPAVDTISHRTIVPYPITTYVTNGLINSPLFTLVGNDILSPTNTQYYALFKDAFGLPDAVYVYSVSGSTYDIGSAVPSPITTNNISYQDLNGLRSLSASKIGSVLYADQFTGTDCGSRINFADTILGGSAGEIWVNQACGTSWTTPVSISANHVLRCIQGGTYNIGATITLNATSSTLVGSPSAMSSGNASFAPCLFKESNAANLPAVVKCVGSASLGGCDVENIIIDGNKANQTCPSPPCYGIWDFKNPRSHFGPKLSVQNAFSADLMIESSSGGNESGATDVIDSMLLGAGGSCLKVVSSADTKATHNEFENCSIGVELIDAPTTRLTNNDFGGNVLQGLKETCTLAAFGPAGFILNGGQFGNNGAADELFVDAWTGSAQCPQASNNTITGVQFIGKAAGTPANTYDAIHIQNSKWNIISGNNISANNGEVSFKNAIEFGAASATESGDIVIGNSLNGWATNSIAGVPASACLFLNLNANNQVTSQCNFFQGSAPNFSTGIQINSGTVLTGQTGSGANIVTDNSPTITGNIGINNTPSSLWTVDAAKANALVTIANNGTYDLAVGSGLIIIHNNSTGQIGLFLCAAGATTLISDPSAVYSITGGTAAKTNFFYNGSTAYRIENKTGGSVNYYITMIRTRNAV